MATTAAALIIVGIAADAVNGESLNLILEDCGGASAHGRIESLDKSSITIREDATVTGSGTIDEDVIAGTITITLRALGVMQLYQGDVCASKEFDLPLGIGKVNWKGLSCPVVAGDIDVAFGVKLFALIPPDMLKRMINIVATGSSADDELLCMNLYLYPHVAYSQLLPNGNELDIAWDDCGDEHTNGKITSIDESGSDIIGHGSINKAVTAGNFTIAANVGGISQNFQGDICAAKEFHLPLGLGKASWAGLACPVAARDIGVSLGMQLAATFPGMAKADITVAATGSSAHDKLFCLSLHAQSANTAIFV